MKNVLLILADEERAGIYLQQAQSGQIDLATHESPAPNPARNSAGFILVASLTHLEELPYAPIDHAKILASENFPKGGPFADGTIAVKCLLTPPATEALPSVHLATFKASAIFKIASLSVGSSVVNVESVPVPLFPCQLLPKHGKEVSRFGSHSVNFIYLPCDAFNLTNAA